MIENPFEKNWFQEKIDFIIYCIKLLYRRFAWGFNPRDIWALDHSLARWVLPRLKKLRETKQGVPPMEGFTWGPEQTELEFKLQCEMWDTYMLKMIKAFEHIIDENNRLRCGEKEKRIDKEIEEGLYLFAKYYRYLAD